LWWCDRKQSTKENTTMRDGFFVGIAQVASIFPGVSRLGACLSMMRYLRYSRSESYRFSIILSLPPVAGACFLKSIKFFTGQVIIENWNFVLIGCLFSFFFGLLSLVVVSAFLKKYTMTSIVIYRIIFGLFIAAYFM
jgi:undecaprenyl-diphosphatase